MVRPVLLVHGGRFAASCWERLAPLLEDPVIAVDLPGRGARASVDLATVGIEACVEAVVEDAGGWDDIVLVGHSLAGVVLPGAATALGDRVARLVFAAAAVPFDGGCVFDTMSPELHESVVANLVDGIYRPEGPSAASYLCNDMDDDSTAFTLACRVAESVRLLAEPVDLTATRSVPCTYVRLTLDATLPLGAQDRAAAALGDPDVVDLAAGHMAMISAPGALARIIEGARSAV